MKIKRNIAISDSGFIFDPSSGNSFTTNPIGLQILNLLKEAKTEKEIEQFVLDHYDTNKTAFEKDYNDFVGMLSKLKLTETYEKD